MKLENLAKIIEIFVGVGHVIFWAMITFAIVGLINSCSEKIKTTEHFSFQPNHNTEECPPIDCDKCKGL